MLETETEIDRKTNLLLLLVASILLLLFSGYGEKCLEVLGKYLYTFADQLILGLKDKKIEM